MKRVICINANIRAFARAQLFLLKIGFGIDPFVFGISEFDLEALDPRCCVCERHAGFQFICSIIFGKPGLLVAGKGAADGDVGIGDRAKSGIDGLKICQCSGAASVMFHWLVGIGVGCFTCIAHFAQKQAITGVLVTGI